MPREHADLRWCHRLPHNHTDSWPGVGQELFDAGLINSDTDSRVWRAKGWTGLDYAILGDGYAYHTPADRVERIGPGVAQSYVDTVVAIAGRVADIHHFLPTSSLSLAIRRAHS